MSSQSHKKDVLPVNVGSKLTILVVDDEPLVRLNAAEMIRDSGWNAIEAADAEEALDLLLLHPDTDVLFTDINMPGDMDGLALAERVRSLQPHIGIVITSGKRAPTLADMRDGAAFLPKPYGFDALIEMLRSHAHSIQQKRASSGD